MSALELGQPGQRPVGAGGGGGGGESADLLYGKYRVTCSVSTSMCIPRLNEILRTAHMGVHMMCAQFRAGFHGAYGF